MRLLSAFVFLLCAAGLSAAESIDRHALVTRHNPTLHKLDAWAPLSVGNGQFAFTADITGLQTLGDHYYDHGIPLETLARWAWHETPNTQNFKLSDANRQYTAYGKTQGYPTNDKSPAGRWLRENPHDVPIGQLALDYTRALTPADFTELDQTLDLWTGTLKSSYVLDGQKVTVTVACAPDSDTLAVRVESSLLSKGKLGVRLAFPRGHDINTKNNPKLDWARDGHTTTVNSKTDRQLELTRSRDAFSYRVNLSSEKPLLLVDDAAAHAFRLGVTDGTVLEFTVTYAPTTAKAVKAPAVFAAATAFWPKFWQSGGAIDFTGSRDVRAAELERRVILSQYLTAIQFGGDTPPQESGLTNSTWYGKHHTEMIWWHAAHFALWGRESYLANALGWYQRSLPVARAIAQERGLEGARWPKMVGPGGRESPGGNPFIHWNQPHPIELAELVYRNQPTPETLAKYRELVFETATGMASLLHWDEKRGTYLLGPPLWIAQEIYDQSKSVNPTYELSQWATSLEIAQKWRERLGMARDQKWEHMRTHLSPLPQKNGVYVALESHPDTWENKDSRHDHPSFLMAFGVCPGDGVDRAVMDRTLDAVLQSWDWETKIWGWDYPMIAITAARLGHPEKAVDILLKNGPNNGYTTNGHNPQRGDLPVYLPGNGALLSAVAMMAAGWDGGPTGNAPGFPREGWVVRSEGLHKLP